MGYSLRFSTIHCFLCDHKVFLLSLGNDCALCRVSAELTKKVIRTHLERIHLNHLTRPPATVFSKYMDSLAGSSEVLSVLMKTILKGTPAGTLVTLG